MKLKNTKKFKAEITAGLITLILLLSIAGVQSVTRTITSDGDNILTFIKNSNGNYWAATGANLQAAIDDLTSGGEVNLPNATIDLTTTMWVNNSNVSIIGHGTTLKCADNTHISNYGMLRISLADNVLVKGIIFDGNVDGGGRTKGVYIGGIGETEFTRVTECQFWNVSTAVWLNRANHSRIDHNLMRHIGNITYDAGVGMPGIMLNNAGWGCSYNTIAYNDVKYVREHGIKIYSPDTGSQQTNMYNKVLYNHFSEVNLGDTVYPALYGEGMDISSSGNEIIGNTVTVDDLTHSSGILVGTSNNTISDNTIIFTQREFKNGIKLQGTPANPCENNTVTGNKILGFDGSSGNGIYIKGARHNTISNNICRHFEHAIYLYGGGAYTDCEYNIITENILSGRNMYFYDNVSYNLIKDNDFSELSYSPKLQAGSGDISMILNNNTVKDNPGYDNSTYEYIPTSGSSPYTNPSDGATYFCTTNQTMAVYWNSKWWFSASYT